MSEDKFTWYKNSYVCYAYLSDVPSKDSYQNALLPDSHFRRSLWFTRGWTLQELLAPWQLLFLAQDWTLIGDRDDRKVQMTLSEITGINDLRDYKSASVTQKMSWVSLRTTTRIEDMAYCMLGIFGVQMPPLYGEGRNAFRRLQIELLQISDDESIFAWKASPRAITKSPMRGMLAEWPTEFRGAGDIERRPNVNNTAHYMMTNRGLLFHSPYWTCYITLKNGDRSPIFCVPLQCARRQHKEPITIFLWESRVFSRAFPSIHAHRDFWSEGYTSKSAVMEEVPSAVGESTYIQDAPTPDKVAWHCLEVKFVIRRHTLQELLHDIDTAYSLAGSECFGVEDGPYRFRFWLIDTAIVEVLFNFSLATGVKHYLVLRIFNRTGELLTSIFDVQDDALPPNGSSGFAEIKALRRPRLSIEIPGIMVETVDPTRYWTKREWSHKIEGMASNLIFRRSGFAPTWRCELELQPNDDSAT
jgi:hypothetical protein